MIIYIDNNGNENVIRNDNIAIDLFKRGSIKKDTLVKTSIRGEWKKAEEIEIFQNLLEVINKEISIEPENNNFENKTKEDNKNIEEETELEIKEQKITSSVPSSNTADENSDFNEIVEEQILKTEESKEELNKAVPTSQSDKTKTQNIKLKKMGFVEAIKTCFKKYFDFSGRARRSEYWYFLLLNLIALFGFLLAGLPDFYGIFYLTVLIPSLSVTIRRLHDIGKSGVWFFISFIPIVGGLLILIFVLMDSQPARNKYGKNPKI